MITKNDMISSHLPPRGVKLYYNRLTKIKTRLGIVILAEPLTYHLIMHIFNQTLIPIG